MAFEGGPYIQAACFCESVIQGNDGTLSLIRIIDQITHTVSGVDVPDDMPPVNHSMTLVLMLKSESALGRFNIAVKIEQPSGIKIDGPAFSVHLDGGNKGQNMIPRINITFTQEGIYWFRIYIDEGGQLTHLTSLPFLVKYQRVLGGTTER